jgi:SAM-dependent methyltransferase
MSITKKLRRRVSDTLYRVGPAQYYQPAYAQIAAVIGLVDGAMLDVGCGPGWLCMHVAAGKPNIDAVGIDSSVTMVETATRNKGPRLNITIREMSGEHIKFPEATFDVVTAVQTAHHWKDASVIVSEMYRVLKPGGRLYLYEADRERTTVPEGWIARRSGWPPDAIVTAGWKRFGMNEGEWADLEVVVRASDFSNVVCDEHGFYRRLVAYK